MLTGSVACSCGRHLTWRCQCGAVRYGPVLGVGCSLHAGQPTSASPQWRSGVASCLLNELHPGGQSELGVDVGEVGLHSAR